MFLSLDEKSLISELRKIDRIDLIEWLIVREIAIATRVESPYLTKGSRDCF
jgi:hypothetical protein